MLINVPDNRLRLNLVTLMAAFALFSPAAVRAQTFTTTDGGFTFNYPQRWVAAESDGAIKLTAADGSGYRIKLDAMDALPSGSPVNDAAAKQAATKLALPIAPGSAFVRASSVAMDHGLAASFRFKMANGNSVDIWIGVIGKHSVVLTPEKAGQSGQAIGLAVIFQSMAFTDALPKQPVRTAPQTPVSVPRPGANKQVQTPNTGAAGSARTVLYSKQLEPIISQRCVACHNSNSASGGFDASTFNAFVSGGSRGDIISAGNPARSSLIDYLTGAKNQMPKGSAPLPSAQIELFRQWIREGATNDLSPTSASPGAANTFVPAGPGKRVRKNNGTNFPNGASGRAAGQPKPMESYAGHLATNDTSFELKLYTNLTATANWTFDQPNPARYEGTFTSVAGVYNIQLNLVSGTIPGGSKSLKLTMQATGTDVVGRFSLDTNPSKYKIIGLQLAEIDNATKNASRAAGSGNRKRKQPSNSAIIRKQNKLMRQQMRATKRRSKGKRI